MYLNFSYRWYDLDIEENNHHKFSKKKSLGFIKVAEEDGYDTYELVIGVPLDWSKTYMTTSYYKTFLLNLYSKIRFKNAYTFSVVDNFTDGFRNAFKYIESLEHSFVDGYNGKPDLVFVEKIASFNGGKDYHNVDLRDVLSFSIKDYVMPISKVGSPKLDGHYYVCPECGHPVYKNYEGCCNCKTLIKWDSIE